MLKPNLTRHHLTCVQHGRALDIILTSCGRCLALVIEWGYKLRSNWGLHLWECYYRTGTLIPHQKPSTPNDLKIQFSFTISDAYLSHMVKRNYIAKYRLQGKAHTWCTFDSVTLLQPEYPHNRRCSTSIRKSKSKDLQWWSPCSTWKSCKILPEQS